MKIGFYSFAVLMLVMEVFFVSRGNAQQPNPVLGQPVSTAAPNPDLEPAIAVTVTDSKGKPTLDLAADDFSLSAEGKPLEITSVQLSDVPSCVGLILDRSGSMRSKNATPVEALAEFIKASNPKDQFFVVNFSDDPHLDQDFTTDASLLQSAFDKRPPRGGTALYDAVIVSADHLMKGEGCSRKILMALTDGGDNDSNKSLSQAAAFIGKMPGLTLYVVTISSNDLNGHISRAAIEALVAPVDGKALFVGLNKVENAFREIAVILRSEYIVTYKPENPSSADTFRRLTVTARSKGHKDLHVHIRPMETSDTSITTK